MYWQIQATATFEPKDSPGWERTTQIPTFYLHSAVQGIVNVRQALAIGVEVIKATNPDAEVHATAYNMTTGAYLATVDGEVPSEDLA